MGGFQAPCCLGRHRPEKMVTPGPEKMVALGPAWSPGARDAFVVHKATRSKREANGQCYGTPVVDKQKAMGSRGAGKPIVAPPFGCLFGTAEKWPRLHGTKNHRRVTKKQRPRRPPRPDPLQRTKDRPNDNERLHGTRGEGGEAMEPSQK